MDCCFVRYIDEIAGFSQVLGISHKFDVYVKFQTEMLNFDLGGECKFLKYSKFRKFSIAFWSLATKYKKVKKKFLEVKTLNFYLGG